MIQAEDPTGSADPIRYYRAFYDAINYHAGGKYNTGWYIPSAQDSDSGGEWSQLYANMTIINRTIETLQNAGVSAKSLGGEAWSSHIYSKYYDYSYCFDLDNGHVIGRYRGQYHRLYLVHTLDD